MKFSICVPQYNRIKFLLKSLLLIESQSFEEIEILISDDCSTDNTQEEIEGLRLKYKFPISYHRFSTNQGYDRNLRKCIEMSSGDYCIILGNDDTINPKFDLKELSHFLEINEYPEIGFVNYFEEGTDFIYKRAKQTVVVGKGKEIALAYYSCFSFVAGIVINRKIFLKYNTDKYDGSIYAQIYLAVLIISKQYRLFSVKEPVVIKDILIDGSERNSYRDTLARSWKQYKKVDGGLPSVIHVLYSAFIDAGVYSEKIGYKIFKKIYLTTVPFWVMDYKQNRAFPEAIGLIHGMFPPNINHFMSLSFLSRLKIASIYVFASGAAILFPTFIFKKLRTGLYNYFKK